VQLNASSTPFEKQGKKVFYATKASKRSRTKMNKYQRKIKNLS
jgi:hypothetical protein